MGLWGLWGDEVKGALWGSMGCVGRCVACGTLRGLWGLRRSVGLYGLRAARRALRYSRGFYRAAGLMGPPGLHGAVGLYEVRSVSARPPPPPAAPPPAAPPRAPPRAALRAPGWWRCRGGGARPAPRADSGAAEPRVPPTPSAWRTASCGNSASRGRPRRRGDGRGRGTGGGDARGEGGGDAGEPAGTAVGVRRGGTRGRPRGPPRGCAASGGCVGRGDGDVGLRHRGDGGRAGGGPPGEQQHDAVQRRELSARHGRAHGRGDTAGQTHAWVTLRHAGRLPQRHHLSPTHCQSHCIRRVTHRHAATLTHCHTLIHCHTTSHNVTQCHTTSKEIAHITASHSTVSVSQYHAVSHSITWCHCVALSHPITPHHITPHHTTSRCRSPTQHRGVTHCRAVAQCAVAVPPTCWPTPPPALRPPAQPRGAHPW